MRQLATCRSKQSACELLARLPHFGNLEVAHAVEYMMCMDMYCQRLPWSRGSLPDAAVTLGTSAELWLALRRKCRSLTCEGDWPAEERQDWLRSMRTLMPTSVWYSTLVGGRSEEVDWKPRVSMLLLQANSCKALQVLQTWLSGKSGRHVRTSLGPEPVQWSRKRWDRKRKRQ